jgi:branched-chain amino acid transport system substrate-binding protein
MLEENTGLINTSNKNRRVIMKKMLVVIAVVTCLFFLAGVLNAALAQTKAPYKIGFIVPLTGYLSWLGEYMKKGAEVQVEMINKAGGVNGRPLELVTYDDQSSPETATRHAQRLVSGDKVVAMMGTGTAVVSGAVSSVANKSKVPAVIQSGYALSEKETFTFNNAHPTEFAISRPMMYFRKKGINQIALLMPIGPLGELGSGIARKHAPNFKITILGEEKFDVKAPDVTAQLAKLRTLNPQAIMAFTTGEPAALLARNMAQMSMSIPIVVSHGNATPGFLKLVAQTPTMVIVPSGKIMAIETLGDKDPVKKVVVEFNRAYQAKYGEPANYYSGQQADAVSLIAEGLKVTKSDDPVKLRDAIENIKGFAGNNGVYNMSPTDHQGTRMEDMILLTIKDGKWAVLD